ncbi:hypothetical protein WJX79_004515 [Trebouxia sp. C0005]
MLGGGKCPDPYNSTHYHRLKTQAKSRRTSPAAVQFQPNDEGGLTQVPCPQQGMLGTACPSPVQTLKVLAAIAARQEGMQGEDTNLWLDKVQLILKLQQAEKLLTAQSDLIDGLRAQLGDDQQHGLPAQELQHQQLDSRAAGRKAGSPADFVDCGVSASH